MNHDVFDPNDEDYRDKVVGAYLQCLRNRFNFSIKYVSACTGINEFRLRQLENGNAKHSINKKEVRSFSVLFNVSPNEINKIILGELFHRN